MGWDIKELLAAMVRPILPFQGSYDPSVSWWEGVECHMTQDTYRPDL